MATMTEINPQEGDVIKGATGSAPVCVVSGELFWNGQFISAYRGDKFEVVSRSGNTPSAEELSDRETAKDKARKADALDCHYA